MSQNDWTTKQPIGARTREEGKRGRELLADEDDDGGMLQTDFGLIDIFMLFFTTRAYRQSVVVANFRVCVYSLAKIAFCDI